MGSRRTKALASLMLIAATMVSLTPGARAEVSSDDLFAGALRGLSDGRTNDAVAQLEALGDRGVVDPVVSFDRGLAYAQRVRQHQEVPGDLGRAAHGFEEARELTHDPSLARDAQQALTLVRAEVARRRARAGEPSVVDETVPLPRAFARLASEDTWALLALAAALALGASLFARALLVPRRARIGAAIALFAAVPALALFGALSLVARYERLHRQEGIVVAPAARLADDRHIVVSRLPPLTEASRVTLEETSGGFVKVRGSGASGWVPSSSVRPLLPPE